MKLESINSKKFEKFKGDTVIKSINLVGGRRILTRKVGATAYTDCWEDSTGNDIHASGGDYDHVSG